MEPTTVQRFINIPNICAIKEASGSVQAVQQLRAYMPASFHVYSGDDALTLDFLKAGATGVVSVASHCVGLDMQLMIQSYHNGDIENAETIQSQLEALFKVLFITSNPVPVKAALRLLGHPVGSVRLPLVDVSSEEETQIKHVLQELNLL